MRLESVSINPANGSFVGSYPAHDSEAIEALLTQAQRGYLIWSELSPVTRADFLLRLADILTQRRQELATLITTEMGKVISAALAEVDKCVTLCRWYAGNLETLLADEVADVSGDGNATVSYLPLGIVLGVMPWNFPLWQVLRAAVPIMSAGNGFILKQADNVQGSALALADCFKEAEFPDGAFCVVNADRDAVAGLISDPRVCGVTVTAGVAAGSTLAAEAGRNLKKSVLELGGSDPFIVLADANIEKAVSAAVTARFQNCGQVCIAAKRIILEKSIAEEFTQRFVEMVRAIIVGDPLDPKTEMGPMARIRLRSEVHELVEQSVAQGARIVLGGQIPEGAGSYYPPTVMIDVNNEMPICREEVFGPVAPLLLAENVDHAIKLANDSEFGLSASLWSENLSRASALSKRLQTGAVYINAISASDPRVPIGGVKKSGYGRELSHFGIREFCNVQLQWVRD